MDNEDSGTSDPSPNTATSEQSKPAFTEESLVDIIGDFIDADGTTESQVSEEPVEKTSKVESDEVASVEETAEPDTQEEPEIVEESEEPEEPKDKGWRKRVDKLTAKRHELESQVDGLQDEIKELRSVAEDSIQVPTQNRDLSCDHLKTAADVDQYIDDAENTVETISEFLEDGDDDAIKLGESEFTRQQARSIRAGIRKALRNQLPQRKQYLKTREELLPKVYEAFPFWKDKGSKEYQFAMQIAKARPQIKQSPLWEQEIGIYMLGVAQWNKQVSDSKQRKPRVATRKAPVGPGAPRATPAQVAPADAKRKAARQRLRETGNRDDLPALMDDFV